MGWVVDQTDLEHLVDLGEGVHTPPVVTVRRLPEEVGDPISIVEFQAREGSLVCTSVRVEESEGGREVRPIDLELEPGLDQIADWIGGVSVRVQERKTEDGATVRSILWHDPFSPPPIVRRRIAEARRAGRRKITDAKLEKAAEVYRAALDAGDRPAAAVADHFAVEQRTAGKYIALARDKGFLGPSLGRGRAGEQRSSAQDQ